MRYGLKGKATTRPDSFRLVLGPCAQFYPFEASEQKWGQTTKIVPKRDIALVKIKKVKIG